MFSTTSEPPGSAIPWYAGGCTTPAEVESKVMFTTASVVDGLYNDRERLAPEAVEPCAKYQFDAVDEAHGAVLQPSGPATTSDTPTPPPSNKTVAATQDPGAT
jgi:hypothetical protein